MLRGRVGEEIIEQNSSASLALLQASFRELTGLLRKYRTLWHPRPYVALPVPWEAEHPGLAGWLRSRTPAQLEQLRAGEQLHPRLRDIERDVDRVVPASPASWRTVDVAKRHRWQIQQRKLEQVRHFLGATANRLPAQSRVLDWCAGKGHLGRTAAATVDLDVDCAEIDAALCRAGQVLAERAQLSCTHIQADVLSPAGLRVLAQRRYQHILGLHACGDLHAAMLRFAVKQGSSVVLAPCCYHRTGRVLTPMSATAQRSDLALDQDDLRLITSAEVVARPVERRMRRRAQVYRIALDRLRQRQDGVDRYRPVRGVPRAWVRADLRTFCQQVAQRDGFALPSQWSEAELLETAERHVATANALGLVRAPFRKALERWVLLDRAIFLAEAGYTVQLQTFCSEQLTPRNHLILGDTLPPTNTR